MSHPLLNLTARDFDAYAADKATSNAYSRPRIEVKQRALAWARGVVLRLNELGIDVEIHASDEHPTLRNKKRVDCQWIFFSRDEKAREELERLLDGQRSLAQAIDDPSPYTRHAFLALRIDASAVDVCFAVHPDAKVDVENLRALLHARANEAGEGDELMRALAALPEQFTIGVGAADRVACSAATHETIRGMLELAGAGQTPLWIGWSVPRAAAIEHGAILDEQLQDALVALGPIHQLVAWSRQNDRIALDHRIEGAREERARTHAEVVAQNERWRVEQERARRKSQEQAQALHEATKEEPSRRAPRAAPPPAAPRPSLATLFRSPKAAPREAAPAPAVEPAGAPQAPRVEERTTEARRHGDESKPTSAPPGLRGELPPGSAAVASVTVTGFEKGARVRVLTGAFTDKIGVIGEVDGRGGARVLLGLLSTRIELASLEPVVEGRERPTLQSSHRRPASPPRPPPDSARSKVR